MSRHLTHSSPSGLVGVDVGTTSCKAGLFDADGSLLRLGTKPTPAERAVEGGRITGYDPGELWQTAASAIREAVCGVDVRPSAVSVASMAEAGLLIDRSTGKPRTPVLPWYDTRTIRQAEAIAQQDTPRALFQRTGLRPSFKYGLAKLLWLREWDPAVTDGAVWLSVADYIVYRLTGRMATDPSLAARTYAFRIQEGCWDEAWIRHFDLDPALFPEVLPSGIPVGSITPEGRATTGLPAATQAGVAGHDHICALLAAGIVEPGPMLDSLGTAESLLGVVESSTAGTPGAPTLEREFESGLALVPHVLPGRLCWLGGLSAAGGSVEWLRAQLADEPLPYDALDRLVQEADPDPTEIIYFPYLSGSGAPCPDQRVRAAFVGLSASHSRGDLARAVLEGTAYEAEAIRQAAERMMGQAIDEIVVVGGGAKNRAWLQIKADVSGCRYQVPALPEATALGAALVAALGAGVLSGPEEVRCIAAKFREEGQTTVPDAERHQMYRRLYENGYARLQGPLRQVSRDLIGLWGEETARRDEGGRTAEA